MLQHFKISLYGKVQGVFLRRTIEREANRLGLVGFVKNEEDGSVSIEVEGKNELIQKLVDWIKEKKDSELEGIGHVETDAGEFQAFEKFEIRG